MVVRLACEGLCSHGAWWVDTPLRDKRVLCWCTVGCLGQHNVVPVGLSCRLAALVVVGCVWGLCCVRTV